MAGFPTNIGSGIDLPYGIGNYWDYANQSGSPWDTASGSDNSSQSGLDPTSLASSVGSDALSFASSGGSPLSLLGLGGPLSALFGGNSEIGSLFGFIPGLLGGLLSPGVPTGAKTQGAETGLEGSGSPLLQLLGQYMQGQGGGNGSNVLSNPAFAKSTNTFADVLSWLSGQELPGYKQMGSTGEIAGIPPPAGAPYTKPVNIMGIQSNAQLAGELGQSPNLNPTQIQAILPQIQQLLAGGGSIASLKTPLAGLAKSAPSASAGTATGGSASAALQLGDESGQDELTSILQALTQRQGQGGGGMAAQSPWDKVPG